MLALLDIQLLHSWPQCPECGRTFDLTDPTNADEMAHGHDCEEHPT